MTLTNREKFLLIILAFVALIAAFVLFAVRPLSDLINHQNEQLADLSDQETEMRVLLDNEQQLKQSYEDIGASYVTAKEDFPAIQKSYDIHMMITERCSMANVTLDSMGIGSFAAITDTAKAVITKDGLAVYKCTVNIAVSGSYENILKLEDDFQNFKKNIFVSAFSITSMDSSGTNKTATMHIDIYAIDMAPAS